MSKKKKSKRTNIAEQFLSDLVMEPVELPSFLSEYVSAANQRELSESILNDAKNGGSAITSIDSQIVTSNDETILDKPSVTADFPILAHEEAPEVVESGQVEAESQADDKSHSADDHLASTLKQAVPAVKWPSRDQKRIKQRPLDDVKNVAFFKYPHELMEFVVNSDLSKNDRRVYDCLLRNTLGRWKDTCQAGYTFIGNYTGIKHKNVIARAIERLVSVGLVVIVDEPDYGKGTTYFVPKAKEYLAIADDKSEITAQGSIQIVNSKQNVDGIQSVNSGVSNLYTGGVNNLYTNKESTKEIKKKSLSTEKMWITDFLKVKIPDVGRRERGERVFMNLVNRGLKQEEIVCAYEWVEKNGMVGSGGAVGDIAKYVEAFHDRILTVAKSSDAKRVMPESTVAKLEADQAKQAKEDEAAFREANIALSDIVPDKASQTQFISDLRDKYVESMRSKGLKKEYVEVASRFSDETILLMWHRGELT